MSLFLPALLGAGQRQRQRTEVQRQRHYPQVRHQNGQRHQGGHRGGQAGIPAQVGRQDSSEPEAALAGRRY